jgi:putative flippase GtrA
MISARFIRFVLVGIVNTIFGYGCFAFLLYLGLHYALAGFLATVAGIIFNFKSIGTLVFQSNENFQLIRFVAVYGITYCIGTLSVGLMGHIGISPYVAGAAMLIPMSLLSYLLNKYFVFKNAKTN